MRASIGIGVDQIVGEYRVGSKCLLICCIEVISYMYRMGDIFPNRCLHQLIHAGELLKADRQAVKPAVKVVPIRGSYRNPEAAHKLR